MVLSPTNEIPLEFWMFLWKLESGAKGIWAMIPKLILETQTW